MEARDGSGPCPSFEFGSSAVRGVVLGNGKHRSCLWRWFVQCSGWFDGRGAANVGCGSRCHTEEFCMKF
jgi:hypothetical protein